MISSEQASIGIIGGADGPTTIFISDFPIFLVALGIIAVAVVIVLATKSR